MPTHIHINQNIEYIKYIFSITKLFNGSARSGQGTRNPARMPTEGYNLVLGPWGYHPPHSRGKGP